MTMTLEQIQEEIHRNKFLVLYQEESYAEMRCVCGEIFSIDATLQLNLRFNGSISVPICPSCGLNPVTGQLGD